MRNHTQQNSITFTSVLRSCIYFFVLCKCMSQYLWLWNCALFHSTKLVIVGPSGSSYKLYTVPRTWSILPPSSADTKFGYAYSFHFSLYSSSTYFSFEHCEHTVHVLSKCLHIVTTHSVNNLYIIVNETLSILHEGIHYKMYIYFDCH